MNMRGHIKIQTGSSSWAKELKLRGMDTVSGAWGGDSLLTDYVPDWKGVYVKWDEWLNILPDCCCSKWGTVITFHAPCVCWHIKRHFVPELLRFVLFSHMAPVVWLWSSCDHGTQAINQSHKSVNEWRIRMFRLTDMDPRIKGVIRRTRIVSITW